MKKVLFLLLTVICSLPISADEATELKYESMDNVLYITGTLQLGEKSNLYLMMKNTATIGTVCAQFTLPTGITISEDDETTIGAAVTSFAKQTDGSYKLAYQHSFAASTTPVIVATIPVSVASTVSLGEHKVIAQEYQMVKEDLSDYDVTNVYTNVTVQRAIPVEPAGDDYALEAIPTGVETGATTMTIPVNFKNEGYVRGIDFTIEYPTGMLTTKIGKKYPLTLTDMSRFDTEDAATVTVAATEGTGVSFTNVDLDLINPNGSGSLLSIPVTLTDVADGVYTIKFSGIKAYVTDDQAEDIKTVTMPDYYFSVFVGTPTETDPIVYGHYTAEAQAALKDAATNFASVDMSECTLDATEDEVSKDLAGILVYGPENTSYTIKETKNGDVANNWYSICLPFAPSFTTSKVYTITDMSTDSETGKLTVAEATTTAADTPYLVKVASNEYYTSVKGYAYADAKNIKDTQIGTKDNYLVGGYEKANLTAGYYVKNDKFWACNDNFNVAPFKAYISATAPAARVLKIVDEATAIDEVNANQDGAVEVYGINGVRQNNVQTGVNIVKMSDGRVVKVITK